MKGGLCFEACPIEIDKQKARRTHDIIPALHCVNAANAAVV